MAVAITPLFTPVQLGASPAALFTAAAKTRIDKLVLTNSDPANPYTYSVYLVPDGGAADATTVIVNDQTLLAGLDVEITELMGQVLNVGWAIHAEAGTAAKLNAFGSGITVS